MELPMYLIEWLDQSEYGQYGECHGKDLDRLIELGLAQIHAPGEHQHFITNDWDGTQGMMYRAVSLTDAGRAALAQRQEGQ